MSEPLLLANLGKRARETDVISGETSVVAEEPQSKRPSLEWPDHAWVCWLRYVYDSYSAEFPNISRRDRLARLGWIFRHLDATDFQLLVLNSTLQSDTLGDAKPWTPGDGDFGVFNEMMKPRFDKTKHPDPASSPVFIRVDYSSDKLWEEMVARILHTRREHDLHFSHSGKLEDGYDAGRDLIFLSDKANLEGLSNFEVLERFGNLEMYLLEPLDLENDYEWSFVRKELLTEEAETNDEEKKNSIRQLVEDLDNSILTKLVPNNIREGYDNSYRFWIYDSQSIKDNNNSLKCVTGSHFDTFVTGDSLRNVVDGKKAVIDRLPRIPPALANGKENEQEFVGDDDAIIASMWCTDVNLEISNIDFDEARNGEPRSDETCYDDIRANLKYIANRDTLRKTDTNNWPTRLPAHIETAWKNRIKDDLSSLTKCQK